MTVVLSFCTKENIFCNAPSSIWMSLSRTPVALYFKWYIPENMAMYFKQGTVIVSVVLAALYCVKAGDWRTQTDDEK